MRRPVLILLSLAMLNGCPKHSNRMKVPNDGGPPAAVVGANPTEHGGGELSPRSARHELAAEDRRTYGESARGYIE